MIQPRNETEESLRAEIQKALENQARWLEMSPALYAEPEEIEQWAKIANLRKQEVERLTALLDRVRTMSGRAESEFQSKSRPEQFRTAY